MDESWMMEMDYLKETLDHITKNKLTCQNIFNFLNEINPNSSPEDEYYDFEMLWKRKLIELNQNFFIIYNSGLWLPEIPSTQRQRLSNQIPWEDFLRKHFQKYISNIPSQEPKAKPSQPLNFQELLNLEFWNHLYNLYGSTVLLFILTKCLIAFLIKDRFYLLISNPDSILHKNITDYTKVFNLRRWKGVKPKGLSTGQGFRNQYESTTLVDKSIPTTIKEATKLGTRDPDSDTSNKSSEPKKRKRNPQDSSSVELSSPMKRTKLSSESTTSSTASKLNSTKRKRSDDNSSSTKRTKVSANEGHGQVKTSIEPNVPCRRWIVPNSATLQKIHDHRLSIKKEISQFSGTSSDPQNTKPEVVSYPNFVNIVNDKYFKKKENNIAKQLIELKVEENQVVLGKRLEGLRIPESLLKDSTTGAAKSKISIYIYTMCEKLARQLGIRIKPRKRSKKTQQKKQASVMIDQTSSSNPCVPEPEKTVDSLQNNLMIHNWLPFSDTFPIPTGTILYDKKPGCKFEPTSSFGQVLSHPGSLSSKQLLKVILDTKVHEPGALNRRGSRYSQDQVHYILSNEVLDDDLCPILEAIIKFHSRVKNVTQLVRSCVLHWLNNYKDKPPAAASKNKRKRVKHPRLLKKDDDKEQAGNVEPVIEEVDLSICTPSTAYLSGGSSNARIPSEQPYKCTNSSSIKSLTPNDPVQHSSGIESSHEKSHHNLSITVIQSPPSKMKKQRKILKKKLKEQTDILPSHILSTISQILVLSGGADLLGSKYNRKQFLKFIRKAVFMSGLNAALHLGELLGGLKPHHCNWLSEVPDITMKYHIFAKSTLWLLTQYVFPILKLGFYVTETNNSRFNAFFFLKDSWKSLSDRIIDRYFKDKKLKPTESSSYCRLRFIPKKDNLRPILCDGTHKLLTPSQQENISLLLHYLNTRICPYATTDYCALRIKWKKFLREWRQENCPKLYYVRADIKDAFPSVNIEKLCAILKELVDEDDSGEWTIKNYFLLDRNRSRVKKSIQHGETWNASINNWPCILMDNGNTCVKFEVSKVLDHLIKILQSKSTVTIKKKRYIFSNGLPQGSFFSHLLCNIYYGYMEREFFRSHLDVPGEFFVRSVDDYFYVSPKPNNVNMLFHKLKKGVPESNCFINHGKSLTNIYVPSNEIVTTNTWVPFCGWRFCITNGHVARNFETYAGQDICSTLTFRMTSYKSPLEFIHKRMGMITALRITPIVLDPHINCQRRIIITLFEGSLMMAFRFYAVCRVIFTNLKSMSEPTVASYLAKSIIRFARCLSRKVANHKSLLYPPTGEPVCKYANSVTLTQPQSSIEDKEVQFLAYHAFLLKLNLHHEVFKKALIPIIRKIRKQNETELGTAVTEYLLSIVGNKLPEHFQAIKI